MPRVPAPAPRPVARASPALRSSLARSSARSPRSSRRDGARRVGAAPRPDDDLPGPRRPRRRRRRRLFVAREERATEWTGHRRQLLRSPPATISGSSADGRAEVDYGGGQFRLAGATNVHVARLDDAQLALFVAQGHADRARPRARPGRGGARRRAHRAGPARCGPASTGSTCCPTGRRRSRDGPRRRGDRRAALGRPAGAAGPDGDDHRAGSRRRRRAQRRGVDGFDTWSADRDRYYERSRSATYVSRQMVGVAELDEYGAWQDRPRLRRRVVPERRRRRLGAVPRTALVVVRRLGLDLGRRRAVGLRAVPLRPLGLRSAAAGAGARAATSRGRSGRRRWSPGTAGRAGRVSVRVGAPVYGWVPLGWGDPYLPSWRNCSRRCWTLYNRPYAVNHAERPHAPPTRYVELRRPRRDHRGGRRDAGRAQAGRREPGGGAARRRVAAAGARRRRRR